MRFFGIQVDLLQLALQAFYLVLYLGQHVN